MDTLTFNSPILLRHLTFSEAKKTPISEIHLDVALRELEMNMDQVRRCTAIHSTATELTTVHRTVYPARVRLPRAVQGYRTKDGAEAPARTWRAGRRRRLCEGEDG
jgi:flap endonuclease-1